MTTDHFIAAFVCVLCGEHRATVDCIECEQPVCNLCHVHEQCDECYRHETHPPTWETEP